MSDAINQLVLLIQSAQSNPILSQRLHSIDQIKQQLHQHPSLTPSIIPHVYGLAADPLSQIRLAILGVVEEVVCRISGPDLTVLSRSLETLGFLINSELDVMKRTIQVATSVYPVMFKWICTNVMEVAAWQAFTAIRQQLFTLLIHPNDGVRVNVVRFYHAVILAESPGLESIGTTFQNDVSVNIVPAGHPFLKRTELITEAVTLLQQMIQLLGANQLLTATATPGLMTADINCMVPLMKKRPNFVPIILQALMQFSRVPPPSFNPTQVRSVLRTVKVALLNALRLPAAAQYIQPITETLLQLGVKAHELQPRRRPQPPPPLIKRPAPSEPLVFPETKRIKHEHAGPGAVAPPSGTPPPQVDQSMVLSMIHSGAVPLAGVVDVIMRALAYPSHVWEQGFARLLQSDVQTLGAAESAVSLQGLNGCQQPPSQGVKPPETDLPTGAQGPVEEAPIPADDDSRITTKTEEAGTPAEPPAVEPQTVEEEEDAYLNEPPPNQQAVAELAPIDYELTDEQRKELEDEAIRRIMAREAVFAGYGGGVAGAAGAAPVPGVTEEGVVVTPTPVHPKKSAAAARYGWMTLVGRLGSREEVKQAIVEFLLMDFRSRMDTAISWLYDLYHVDQTLERRARAEARDYEPQYSRWFHRILEGLWVPRAVEGSGGQEGGVGKGLDAKDRMFTRFLLEVPDVTREAVDGVVRSYCDDAERMQLGISTLRDLISMRGSVKDQCLALLLEYCVHPVKATRTSAIITARRFYAENASIAPTIETFALESMQKLRGDPPAGPAAPAADEDVELDENGEVVKREDAANGDVKMEEANGKDVVGSLALEEAGKAGPEGAVEWREEDVVRHLEIYFALCSRKHEFLMSLFNLYRDLAPSVQRAVRTAIQPLIKNIAAQPAKLYTMIRTFPEGSESLLLRILTLLTEKDPPTPQLIAAVKHLYAERELDARFLIPVIAGLDKGEVAGLLPKVVELLDGTEGHNGMVTQAFVRVLEGAGAGGGKGGEKGPISVVGAHLTPAELMVGLHGMEETAGLKKVIEATTICFTLPTVFKQEVLAVVLQQLVDQPKLPKLFMRTVIQSLNQYKGLAGFVNNTILMRLLNKKVWGIPQIWEGFVRVVTMIFPTSFAILTTLPKEQTQDALKRSPKLKQLVRNYLDGLSEAERGRREVVGILGILSPGGGASPVGSAPGTPVVGTPVPGSPAVEGGGGGEGGVVEG
ncbi:hypothetical protein HDV00_005887 [Rhizophlyctis rosea]|nr:hypothetical protein HDV00_005887 [Rhizophlyctis rosea]